MSAPFETPSQKKERLRREFEGKNVEYFNVLATAWVGSRMEADKTLIALSSAGLGFLVNAVVNKGLLEPWHIWLYSITVISFLVTIFSCLIIFYLNPKVIEAELRELSPPFRLKKFDRAAYISFSIGVLTFVAIGCFSALHKSEKKQEQKSHPCLCADKKPASSAPAMTNMSTTIIRRKGTGRTVHKTFCVDGKAVLLINCTQNLLSTCQGKLKIENMANDTKAEKVQTPDDARSLDGLTGVFRSRVKQEPSTSDQANATKKK